jgi:LuxR family maltose regulon positive regulatory protein
MAKRSFHSNAAMAPGNQLYLERPHVQALMEEAIQARLVTVVAGAGYGKTHSVYSFLRSFPEALTIWLQLSERDNLGWRFWENFAQSIFLYNEGFAKKLMAAGFPDTEQRFNHYLAIPNEELDPSIKYIIVYDDFHLIQDRAVKRFVERSINTPYPNVTSIIISRSEPAINTAALFAKGFMVKITQEDLRFRREETLEYFKLQDIKLNPGLGAYIYQITEGWAFAVHLIALALRNNPAGLGYAQSSMKDNVFKLIEGEIMAPLSPSLRKLLIKLSLIDHLPPALLEALAEDPGLFEEVKNIDSFIRFDNYSKVYQIHHLFLEYLVKLQGEISEEEKRDVFIRAAGWCVENNMKMAAIGYYEKAGAYDELFDVIYTMPLALPDNIAAFMLNMMERAPEEIYEKSAIAWILKNRFLFTLSRFEEAAAELRHIARKFEALEQTPFTSRVLYAAYNHMGFIKLITAMDADHYDFPSFFEKAHSYFPLSGNKLQGPTTIIGLGAYICRVGSAEKGKIEEFIAAAAASIPHLVVTMNGFAYGMDDLARCELAFFRGRLEEAEKFAAEALQKGRKRNQYEVENRAIFYSIRMYLAEGKAEKIEECFKMLDAELEVPEYLNRYIHYDIVRGWFYTQTGAPEKIASWLRNEFEESELNSIMLGMDTVVQAKYYIAQKQYSAALIFLESKGNHYSPAAYLFGRITLLVLEAICRYHVGEKEGALRILESAYFLSEPNGLNMFFIEAGKNMRALAGAALKNPDNAIPREWLEKIRRQASAYAKKQFALSGHFRGQTHKSRKPGAPLSLREMDVLTGLSRGLTREEIAEDNNISVNTVKSVIKNVYNKLGAVNRADAIRLATSLDLLKNAGPGNRENKL